MDKRILHDITAHEPLAFFPRTLGSVDLKVLLTCSPSLPPHLQDIVSLLLKQKLTLSFGCVWLFAQPENRREGRCKCWRGCDLDSLYKGKRVSLLVDTLSLASISPFLLCIRTPISIHPPFIPLMTHVISEVIIPFPATERRPV